MTVVSPDPVKPGITLSRCPTAMYIGIATPISAAAFSIGREHALPLFDAGSSAVALMLFQLGRSSCRHAGEAPGKSVG